ncbi:MAG: inositol monophosphatase [Planctomycetaceae bacterium]|nr:inositol monophosphatase [Planctomycetaceae bacterium]MBT6055458.1 inositol monophosphatase [Planctomycetaceae bacterium]MBT6459067.1 inositol monophosphatase [Planctomycetaceae bacterium]MBT6919998.1 inositol monophosphatase [Planctomycetaceae bacterium]MBT7728237.1 inositol monophosphatase [Planctomycetaceae bacterium]
MEVPSEIVAGKLLQNYGDTAELAARAGGDVLRDWRGRFAVSAKGPRDLVTEADVASQKTIREILLSRFPNHGFIGEEGDQDLNVSPLRWMVDPLDGTSNYVHGFPAYCVSVALAYRDEILAGAIYDPVADECFTAIRGGGARLENTILCTTNPSHLSDALVAVSFPPHVDSESLAVADFLSIIPHVHSVRRTGSTAINLAYLAAGRLDGFWVRSIACWDVAAGLLIASEAGASIVPCRHLRDTIDVPPPTHVSLDRPAFVAGANQKIANGLHDLLVG